MDISTIYSPTAVEALAPAIQGRISPLADIKISLSMISDALDNGYTFPEESSELIPVEIPAGEETMPRMFWVQITKMPDGSFNIGVPSPNPAEMIGLFADVSENRKAWKIRVLAIIPQAPEDH